MEKIRQNITNETEDFIKRIKEDKSYEIEPVRLIQSKSNPEYYGLKYRITQISRNSSMKYGENSTAGGNEKFSIETIFYIYLHNERNPLMKISKRSDVNGTEISVKMGNHETLLSRSNKIMMFSLFSNDKESYVIMLNDWDDELVLTFKIEMNHGNVSYLSALNWEYKNMLIIEEF